ncbi:Chromatin modification-related protein [Yarrowia sp. C11]|nr:Chromatin modification-related protein [Yarrowia sp. E02]KAG5371850.1 Chromatin modification-related protein [Yarrowia sp. C11]
MSDQKMNQYEKLKKQLKDNINKKKTHDKNLNSLEEQIFTLEGAYLEETSHGNLVKGFDTYIKGAQSKKRYVFNEDDRLFSLSSAVFLKHQAKTGAGGDLDDIKNDRKKASSQKRRKGDSTPLSGDEKPTKRSRLD